MCRLPAARAISLPAHVMQARVQMANRQAFLAQDALQQQHMMIARGQLPHNMSFGHLQAAQGAPDLAYLTSRPNMGHHSAPGLAPNGVYGAMGSADDSFVPLRTDALLLQQQQRQQQQQHLAVGNWGTSQAQGQHMGAWGTGALPMSLPPGVQPAGGPGMVAAIATAHAVTAVQQQQQQQQMMMPVAGGANTGRPGDAMWLAAATSGAASVQTLQLAQQGLPAGVQLQLQQPQQQRGPVGLTQVVAAAPAAPPATLDPQQLLDGYQSVSWQVGQWQGCCRGHVGDARIEPQTRQLGVSGLVQSMESVCT